MFAELTSGSNSNSLHHLQYGVLIGACGKNQLYFNNEDYNYYKFKQLGITSVFKSNKCTYCSGNFHSFRRDKENSGRNVALLGF